MNFQKQNYLTIGSAASRRVTFWEAALQKKKISHQVLTYDQVLEQNFPTITTPTLLRITSPGEDFQLKKQLMQLGGCPHDFDFSFKKGLIYSNNYWYLGWCLVLQIIARFIKQNPLIEVLNTPAAIQLAFHKLNSQQILKQQEIRTPRIIINRLSNYDQLIEKLENDKIHQVFIKPYHGSSASGVMAFRQTKNKQLLYTTIQQRADGLYNHLRLQKYNSIAQIKTIIKQMIPSGLLVEEWIRKKTYQQKSVDLRILVINNKSVFVVPRMSKHFITNLHLGNQKGNIQTLEKAWGINVIKDAKALAKAAVAALGGLFYAGVDIAISPNGIPYVLEVNAFGDMLLGITKDGFNSYEYELAEWCKRVGENT